MQDKLSKIAINLILSRLKEYFKVRTDTELANCLDIKQNTISSWKARGMVDFMLIISKCDNISYDWLLEGINEAGDLEISSSQTSEPANQDNTTRREGTRYNIHTGASPVYEQRRQYKASGKPQVPDSEPSRIPLYDLGTTSDLSTLLTAPENQTAKSYLSIPHLPSCDGAVYVRGDQMYPLLKSGDIVLYKRIADTRNIIWGETYLMSFSLEGDEYVTVKVVNKADDTGDTLLLTGHNHAYAPMKISRSSINAIAIVKAFVHFNTMK